jgi:NTE family protein
VSTAPEPAGGAARGAAQTRVPFGRFLPPGVPFAPHHRPFALLLAGGGARGLAHVGVLHALERYGFAPSALVGVSMGAVVAATYALNPRWLEALLGMDTTGFPAPLRSRPASFGERLRALRAYQRRIWSMLRGWGAGTAAVPKGMAMLRALTLDRAIDEGRVPVAVTATDLLSGERVVLRDGNAALAVYASAALAGVVPPLELHGRLLADGGYADIAPVDVARALGPTAVIAVDPTPDQAVPTIATGVQALVRAVEICHHQHAHLRFAGADMVLRPRFPIAIDTLDFGHARTCVAAGIHAVRAARSGLRALLHPAAPAPGRPPLRERHDG